MFKICGFSAFFRCGRQSLEQSQVPLALIWCIKSNLLTSVLSVGVSDRALALFTRMSIPPKVETVLSTAAYTDFSSLISHSIASPFPPAFSISSTAVKIVPGSLGCGLTVLATTAILAPKSE